MSIKEIPDLSLILKSLGKGLIVTDSSNQIAYFNPLAEELLSPLCTLSLGAPLDQCLPQISGLVADCLSTGQSPCVRKGSFGKDPGFSVLINRPEADYQSLGVVCLIEKMDSSAISSEDEALSRLFNPQLSAIVQNSSDGIWVCDGDGTVIFMNRSSEDLNGLVATEIIGQKIQDLVQTGTFERSVTMEVLSSKKPSSLYQRSIRTNKLLLSTGTPVFNDMNEISLVVCNERDMTYLNKVCQELEQTRIVVQKLEDRLSEIDKEELERQDIVAQSGKMRQVLGTALKLAQMEASNILILGESGVGKGMLAKFIHKNSARSKKEFVQINCAALPENLLEAELFGYESGAFTGARQQGKEGLLELAHEGVLFLDEIGDMPLSIQAKLLKYLDDHMVMRLGGTRSRFIDCLIVAATNHDLKVNVKEKSFREDLYYRLSSFIINIPPLRERPEDILTLANYFLEKNNKMFNVNKRFPISTLEYLQSQSFEGNIRELQNLIRRFVVLGEDGAPNQNQEIAPGKAVETAVSPAEAEEQETHGLVERLEILEKDLLQDAFNRFDTTRQMAEYLGVSQPTISRKLKKYGFSEKD